MANVREISDGRPDGQRLGLAASDKVGFFGATPVVQETPAVTVGTDLATVILEIADLRLALVTLGLIDA